MIATATVVLPTPLVTPAMTILRICIGNIRPFILIAVSSTYIEKIEIMYAAQPHTYLLNILSIAQTQ
jgi:hypothetical protein